MAMIDERVSRALLAVLSRLGEALFKPTKLALGFPQIIQTLLISAGHGSDQGHEQLFQASTRWLAFRGDVIEEKHNVDQVFRAKILEVSVSLLAYLNDILVALKHLSIANIGVESDDDDNEPEQAALLRLRSERRWKVYCSRQTSDECDEQFSMDASEEKIFDEEEKKHSPIENAS